MELFLCVSLAGQFTSDCILRVCLINIFFWFISRLMVLNFQSLCPFEGVYSKVMVVNAGFGFDSCFVTAEKPVVFHDLWKSPNLSN